MIPLYVPELLDEDAQLVMDALRRGEISGSAGRYIPAFEERCAASCGARYGICTTSGTTALQLAVAALGISHGDEVILPALTNIASALAVVHANATPVCVDAEPDTWNMDVSQVERLITARTKAIMAVHLYGHPVDMDPLLDLARRRQLAVIEDAAEAHGAEYKGRRTGGLGTVGCLSFYANKAITTGEGGMVVTNDAALADRARSLRNLAFGPVRRFVHEECGFNFRMTNMQAALGAAQIGRLESIVARKRRVARWYLDRLQGARGLRLPVERPWAVNVYWMVGVVLDQECPVARDELAERLRREGIESREFFVPMHLQPAFRKRGLFGNTRLPVAEFLGDRGMYLPSSHTLDESTVARVCDAIRGILD